MMTLVVSIFLLSCLLFLVAGVVNVYYIFFLNYGGCPEWVEKIVGAGLMGLMLDAVLIVLILLIGSSIL